MKLTLFRTAQSNEGTFGMLVLNDRPLCLTCEDPWNDNKTGISCIPAGKYVCKKFSGTKYQNVWQVMNVPGRSAILIHQGNTIKDTQGCILVGSSIGRLEGLPAVGQSTSMLADLRKLLPSEFELEIIDVAAT